MDIFILSNLEILKKVLKKMCNLHIVTATYFYCILNILTDDKRSYTLVFINKKIFLCLELAYSNTILIYYFIYNLKNIHK